MCVEGVDRLPGDGAGEGYAMTRAQFIQQVLAVNSHNLILGANEVEMMIRKAEAVADRLERTGKAPWDATSTRPTPSGSLPAANWAAAKLACETFAGAIDRVVPADLWNRLPRPEHTAWLAVVSAVQAGERERCAQIADSVAESADHIPQEGIGEYGADVVVAKKIAKAIRERE
jgi:hypothetical protein